MNKGDVCTLAPPELSQLSEIVMRAKQSVWISINMKQKIYIAYRVYRKRQTIKIAYCYIWTQIRMREKQCNTSVLSQISLVHQWWRQSKKLDALDLLLQSKVFSVQRVDKQPKCSYGFSLDTHSKKRTTCSWLFYAVKNIVQHCYT